MWNLQNNHKKETLNSVIIHHAYHTDIMWKVTSIPSLQDMQFANIQIVYWKNYLGWFTIIYGSNQA